MRLFREGKMDLSSATKIESIAHHGLIAALGKILKIEEKINSRLPLQDRDESVTRGQSVMAMIINGLGFIERRLYMVQDFFSDKPVERLIGNNVTYEKLNDDNLGRTLDAIYDYNATKLFSEIAFEIGLEHNAMSKFAHLDTTSISVEGEYNREVIDTQGDGANFHITHGYSKDQRKDLKQLVLSLTTMGPASIPIWLETLSGNSADKENFIKTIESAKKFQEELKKSEPFVWVADAALYTKDKLLSKGNSVLWLTRIPETITEAKVLVQKNKDELTWIDLGNGYLICPQESNYGGVKQRWILVFSEQAFKKEINTVAIMLKKKEEALKSAIKKFGKEIYYCEKDANKAFTKFEKRNPLFKLESKIVRIEGQAEGKRGRPKEEDKILKGFKVEVEYTANEAEVLKHENARGKFILGTNDFDIARLPDTMILNEYKNQSKTEGSFRFLKDPSFFASEVYLKKPERIQALMFVMGLCLMIYNVGQYHLRKILEETKETVPNQLGKQTKKPTLKWIFQCFRSLSVVKIFNEDGSIVTQFIANMKELHKKIISFFGKIALNIYGFDGDQTSGNILEYKLLLA